MPLVSQLVEVMRRYLNAIMNWSNLRGFIFRNRIGNLRLWSTDTAEFKTLREMAIIDQNERTGHEIHYSLVSLMCEAGKVIKAIEEMIDHSSSMWTYTTAIGRPTRLAPSPRPYTSPRGSYTSRKEQTQQRE